MTETQGDEIIALLVTIKFLGHCCAKGIAFIIGLWLWKAWWYAKNQREVYLVPLALCFCGASSAQAQTTLFDDQFDGPDGQYLALHSPNINTLGGGWTGRAGTFTLQSNELHSASVPAVWTFAGQADGFVTLEAGDGFSNASSVGIVFRRNAATGAFYQLGWLLDGRLELRYFADGANAGSVLWSGQAYPTAGGKIAVRLEGSAVKVFHNATEKASLTLSSNVTSSEHGIRSNVVSARVRRITHTTLYPPGPTPGGWQDGSLVYTLDSFRSFVVESVGTPPSYFGSSYDDAYEPKAGVDVLEVSTGVAPTTVSGQLSGYAASATNTPYFIRTKVTYGGKVYYMQARSTSNSSGIPITASITGTALHSGWIQAINKWDAAHPVQQGYFSWIYQGTQIPNPLSQTFANNSDVRIAADESIYQATDSPTGVVTLIKHNEESEETPATVWLRNSSGQWHKWELFADGVYAEQTFHASAEQWQPGTPPREEAPGFGPLEGDPGDPDDPDDPEEPYEPPAGAEVEIESPISCQVLPMQSYGNFIATRTKPFYGDQVKYASDRWNSDIRKVTSGEIVRFCGARWWRVLNTTSATLVVRVPKTTATGSGEKFEDIVVTCPNQTRPSTWGHWPMNGHAYLYFLIPDGYTSKVLAGDPRVCGPGTWDYDCDQIPDFYDKSQKPCGWDSSGEGPQTWDHDCDEIPNFYDEDFPPIYVPPSDEDGDGTPDSEDDDIDGDGTPNDQDTTPTGGNPKPPYDPSNGCNCLPTSRGYPTCDQDGDGVCDAKDWDDDGDGIPDSTDTDQQGDLDLDGIPDDIDEDDDGDGTPDWWDDDPDGDGQGTGDNDMDGDGIINVLDYDMDGDNVPNKQDADLDGDGTLNVYDTDVDGDGKPNNVDSDDDGDGFIDYYWPPAGSGVNAGMTEKPATQEEEDQMWKFPGPESPTDGDPTGDIDEDGIQNSQDPDKDGDGIPNEDDPDADGDGHNENADPSDDPDSDCRKIGNYVADGSLGQKLVDEQGRDLPPEYRECKSYEQGRVIGAGLNGLGGSLYCCPKDTAEGKNCGCECFEKLFDKMGGDVAAAESLIPPVQNYDRVNDDYTFDIDTPNLAPLAMPAVPLGGAPGIDTSVSLGDLGASVGVPEVSLPFAPEQGYALPTSVREGYRYLMDNATDLLRIVFVVMLGISIAKMLWRVLS